MYSLINQHARAVVDTIEGDFVTNYEWLFQHIDEVGTGPYRKRFRNFWSMNQSQLIPEFFEIYFDTLSTALQQAPPLREIVATVSANAGRRDGTTTIQFSFATKLLHMTNPHLPIYDSQVAAFYFFPSPPKSDDQLAQWVGFYEFLTLEYQRVLDEGLLAVAINTFREVYPNAIFTDEKVIDSLIWAFVKMSWDGKFRQGASIYS